MPVACNHHPSAVVPLRFSFPCRLCEPPLSDRANVDVVKPPVTASAVINNRFVWNVANPLARIRVESLLAVSPGGVSAATADIVTCAPTGTAWMAPFSPPNCSTEVGHGEQKQCAVGAHLGRASGAAESPDSNAGDQRTYPSRTVICFGVDASAGCGTLLSRNRFFTPCPCPSMQHPAGITVPLV